MSAEHDKNALNKPADPDKRAALKKLGRYAAYTAPATLVLVGYVAATKEGMAISLSPSPPPPPPPT
jgi:hypothetical protein